MVFESLINPIRAEKRPWELFFIGIVYTSLAILISLFVFPDYATLVMIFLTVLAAVPLMYAAIKYEEKKDISMEKKFLIKEHGRALSFFMFLFLGIVFSFSMWYVFLPADTTALLFEAQLKEIEQVQNLDITGNAITLVGAFGLIFFNNIMVMMFSLLFAFFYGVGAIFILTWNASVLGAAIGKVIIANLENGFASAFSSGFIRYIIHGTPEMLAYFMAGLAGSIISVAIIRHDFGSGKFKRVLTDSMDMIFLSVVVLFVAGLLEVFVSPLFF